MYSLQHLALFTSYQVVIYDAVPWDEVVWFRNNSVWKNVRKISVDETSYGS